MIVPYDPSVLKTDSLFGDEEGRASARQQNSSSYFAFHRNVRDRIVNLIATSDECDERSSLMGRSRKNGRTRRLENLASCLLLVMILSTLATLTYSVLLIVMAFNLGSQTHEVATAFKPHLQQIADNSATMASNLGSSSTDFANITKKLNQLSKLHFGEGSSADSMLRNATTMADRLTHFLNHPSIKVSLGE